MKINNFLKKIICISGFIGACLIFTACSAGATIDTNLYVSMDGDGKRVMEARINNEVFDKYFTGSKDELDSIIDENIPSDLKWEKIDIDTNEDGENDDIAYSFTFEFDSIQDYKDKIKKLTDKDITAFDVRNDIFRSGISLDETGIRSSDLFSWLIDALVQKGYIEEDKKEYIFEDGSALLYFKDEEIANYSNYYNVNNMTNYGISNIYISSVFNTDGSSDINACFEVNNSFVEQNGDKFKSYFESITPDGASLDIMSGEITTYVISKDNAKNSEIKSFYSYIFGDGCFSVSYNSEAGNDFYEVVDVLSYKLSFNSPLLSQLSSANIYYLIKDEENLDVSVNDNIYAYGVSNPLFEGFGYYASTTYYDVNKDSSFDLNIKIKKDLSLSGIDVDLRKNEDETFTRTVIFDFGREVSDSALNSIGKKIIAFANDLPEKDNAEFSVTEGKLVIIENGPIDTIEKLDSALYGKGSVSLKEKGGLISIFKTTVFSDSIVFSNFVPSNSDIGIDYSYYISGVSMKNTNPSKAQYSEGIFSARCDGQKLKVGFTSSCFNLTGTLIIVGIAVVLIAVIATIIIILITKKKKFLKTSSKQITEDEIKITPSFCTGCGNALVPDSKFCVHCGKPI